MMAMRRRTSCAVMEVTARCTDAGVCAARTAGTPTAIRSQAHLDTMHSSGRGDECDGRNRETNAPGRTVVRPGAGLGSFALRLTPPQLGLPVGLRLLPRRRVAPWLRPGRRAARLVPWRFARLRARRGDAGGPRARVPPPRAAPLAAAPPTPAGRRRAGD